MMKVLVTPRSCGLELYGWLMAFYG